MTIQIRKLKIIAPKLGHDFIRMVDKAARIALETKWPRGKLQGIYERSVVYGIGANGYIGFHLRTPGFSKEPFWLLAGEKVTDLFDYRIGIAEFVEDKRQISDTAGFIALDVPAIREMEDNGNFDRNFLRLGIGIDKRYLPK